MGEQREAILKGIGSSSGGLVGTNRGTASAGLAQDKEAIQDKEDDILTILREIRADNKKISQETRDLKITVDDLKTTSITRSRSA